MSVDLRSSGSVQWKQEILEVISDQHHRREDEVERVSNLDCRLTTSLKTNDYQGKESALGIMFTMQAASDLDILTLEFNAFAEAENFKVQVYYRVGEFSGATNDPFQWTMLADTVAQPTPDSKGAIIPIMDFKPMQVLAGKTYSLYLHFEEHSVIKIKPANRLIGEESESNALLQTHVGVSLKEGPFPDQLDKASEFNGVIHYRSLQPCEQIRVTTDVELEFAVDSDPEAEVMEDLSKVVNDAIFALMNLDANLIRYKKLHMLELVEVTTSFQGRSEEKCPEEFDMCSLIHSSVRFAHLQSIDSRLLQLDVMSSDAEIGESVTTQSDIKAKYVGDAMIVLGEFIITLKGVPPGLRMNVIQKRYFDRVTTDFLSQFAEMPIYRTEVTDEVAGESIEDRRLGYHGLRGSRYLEGVTQVVTTVYGGGMGSDLRTTVLEAIGGNDDRYTKELARQHLRPGKINEENFGSFFDNVFGITVGVKPADFGLNGTAVADIVEGSGMESDRWMYLCIAGMALSAIWLFCQINRDCGGKPSSRGKQFQDHDTDLHRSPKDFPPAPPNTKRRPSFDRLAMSEHERRPRSMGNLPLSSKSDHGPMQGARSRNDYPPEQMSAKGKDMRRQLWDGLPLNNKLDHERKRPMTKDLKQMRQTGKDKSIGDLSRSDHEPGRPKSKPMRKAYSNDDLDRMRKSLGSKSRSNDDLQQMRKKGKSVKPKSMGALSLTKKTDDESCRPKSKSLRKSRSNDDIERMRAAAGIANAKGGKPKAKRKQKKRPKSLPSINLNERTSIEEDDSSSDESSFNESSSDESNDSIVSIKKPSPTTNTKNKNQAGKKRGVKSSKTFPISRKIQDNSDSDSSSSDQQSDDDVRKKKTKQKRYNDEGNDGAGGVNMKSKEIRNKKTKKKNKKQLIVKKMECNSGNSEKGSLEAPVEEDLNLLAGTSIVIDMTGSISERRPSPDGRPRQRKFHGEQWPNE